MPWKEGVKVFCQVIVDIVHENVAKPFTYQIPDGMELMAGQRVAVPFGHMEKEGIVTALTTDTDVSPAKLRSVIRPLEEYAAIPPELIELAEDMALKSHCPLAETLRLMIRAQMRGGRVHIKTEKTVCPRDIGTCQGSPGCTEKAGSRRTGENNRCCKAAYARRKCSGSFRSRIHPDRRTAGSPE